MKSLCFLATIIAGSLLPATAGAEKAAESGTAKAPAAAKPEQKPAKATTETASAEDPKSPVEKPNTTYMFVGARFRYVIVPKFYLNLFSAGGTTVGVPAFGPEFTLRSNRFEYVLSAMYASYAMDPTPFKSKTDTAQAWELVDSTMKSLYLMSDFTWSSPIDPQWAIIYGAGFGLGIVFGELHRVQAYPPQGADVNDPYSYQPCVGPNLPRGDFCDTSNNHYPGYSEPSWANGGSKPMVFPWLSLQTGVRFKPTHDVMARLDIGWNIFNGPFFGIAGNYGL